MADAVEDSRIDHLIVQSNPKARLVAAVAYRCADYLPINDSETLRQALESQGPLQVGEQEISFEHLPDIPPRWLPITDLADLVKKCLLAIAYNRGVLERSVHANHPELLELATSIAAASETAPFTPGRLGGSW
jgi:hypothetical protein